MNLRAMSDKELKREWHAARTRAADLKREQDRRRNEKKRQREQTTQTRAAP